MWAARITATVLLAAEKQRQWASVRGRNPVGVKESQRFLSERDADRSPTGSMSGLNSAHASDKQPAAEKNYIFPPSFRPLSSHPNISHIFFFEKRKQPTTNKNKEPWLKKNASHFIIFFKTLYVRLTCLCCSVEEILQYQLKWSDLLSVESDRSGNRSSFCLGSCLTDSRLLVPAASCGSRRGWWWPSSLSEQMSL